MGCCAIQDIRPKPILNSNLAKSRTSITSVSLAQTFEIFTEHGSGVVPSAKFQDDWSIEIGLMDERDFTRFEF